MTRTTAHFGLNLALDYIETAIPAGLTVAEHRRGRPRRTSRWERLRHLAGQQRLRKQALVERALSVGGIEAFPGSVRWVRDLRAAGRRTAVVSSSTNADAVLGAAGIRAQFEAIVDGRDIERLGLSGKPAPDMVVADLAEMLR